MTKITASDENWENTGIRLVVVDQIRKLAARNHMKKVILFGSRARGDFRRESDIDLAVSGGDADMLRLDVEEETDTLLKYDVIDLDGSLQQQLREIIEQEGKLLYEKI